MSITVDIDAKIPNNVDLAGDRRLQRALESWQPKFIRWWEELGPAAFQHNPVFLRTAIDVGQQGGQVGQARGRDEVGRRPQRLQGRQQGVGQGLLAGAGRDHQACVPFARQARTQFGEALGVPALEQPEGARAGMEQHGRSSTPVAGQLGNQAFPRASLDAQPGPRRG